MLRRHPDCPDYIKMWRTAHTLAILDGDPDDPRVQALTAVPGMVLGEIPAIDVLHMHDPDVKATLNVPLGYVGLTGAAADCVANL